MKLVTVVPWEKHECSVVHKKHEQTFIQINLKGLSFSVCPVHAAQLIRELSEVLAGWADKSLKAEIGSDLVCHSKKTF